MNIEEALPRAAALVGRKAGIRSTGASEARLAGAVAELAAARGLTLEHYMNRLVIDGDELQRLVDAITVHETSFFRDPMQFGVLASRILPTLGRPILIWSAGCSTGQEAYSLAMALDEAGIREWRIVASDVSSFAVARTQEATYAERELRGLSAARRGRYLRPVGGRWRVDSALTDRVAAVRHNLATDDPPLRGAECSLVFCRNVLIYLTPEHVTACLQRMRAALAPTGYLFIGASEALRSADAQFTLERLGEAFAYRPVGAATARRAGAAEPRAGHGEHRADHAVGRIAASPPAPIPVPPFPRGRTEPPGQAGGATRTPARSPDDARSGVQDLVRDGDRLAAEGDHTRAVAVYRKAVYLAPDDPLGYLRLALSLEASGDPDASRRALLAARAALGRVDPAQLEADLEGYRTDDLEAWLTLKLGADSCP